MAAQTFDPWGAVRSGGVTSTEYNYTGQRKDAGTGLLFYNARYYDPALGRFLSADTIGVDRANPQTRNRYSYVLNNPLKYTDPSGHCADADVDEIAECSETLDTLDQHGIVVDHAWQDWTIEAIRLLLTALYELIQAAGWDHLAATAIKNIFTNNGVIDHITVRRGGRTDNKGSAGGGVITLYDEAFEDDSETGDPADLVTKITFVHELAHIMDQVRGGALANGIMWTTGSTYLPEHGQKEYVPGGSVASIYGTKNHYEDWAESLTGMVYQDANRYTKPGNKGLRMDHIRRSYVNIFFSNH